ncbi:hypothetical protein BEWA_053530 [Theileria equi strain WA]|uniref:Signal peptide-containing protein n=1 Tax=Theileria equi strain WA TaxID=1537102 RepID=L1LDT1_THEEQ|nr:hypothetical protein BEWA_053530 [Theileria equi strain WA]EKX73298.1 hypothetical protein BEWA_053530 [Theileria equi strain WA]|eukprot:XP_004832750.1 hypothetical protein BEWA_053530 [Theileria equi strain WA]
MRFVTALFAVYFLTQCSCRSFLRDPKLEDNETNPVDSAQPFTLNISKPDSTNVVVLEKVNEDITYQLIYPRTGLAITAIADGYKNLWTSSFTTKCMSVHVYKTGYLTLLQVYTLANTKPEFKYFEKIGSRWVAISEEFFDKRWLSVARQDFNRIIKKSLTSDYFVLDLSNPDKSRVFTTEALYNGLTYKAFFANIDETIAKIVFGEDTIWEVGSGKKATSVHLFSKGGEVRLVEVVVGPKTNHTFLFFEHSGECWVPIDEATFNSKYNDLLNDSSEWLKENVFKGVFGKFTPLPGITIDIAAGSNENIDVEENTLMGVTYKSYSPKVDSCNFRKIVDSETNILTIPSSYKCLFVESYTIGKTVLLTVTLKDGAVYEYEYFEKNGGAWSGITQDEFSEKFAKYVKYSSSTNTDIVVNVVMPSNGTYHAREYKEKNYDVRFISPAQGFAIVALYYGRKLIWERVDHEYCSCATFFRTLEHHISNLIVGGKDLYFKEIDGTWYGIPQDEFFDFFNGMSNPEQEPVTLDIANVDLDIIKVFKYNLNTVPMIKYTPIDVTINKVTEGDATIWSGSENCTAVWTCSANGDSAFKLQIIDADGRDNFIYFEKVNSIWKPTDFSTFFKRVGELTEGASKVIKVDVLSSQKGSFTNTVYNDYGVETRLVSPLGGSKIAALYHGEERVWEGKSGEYCTSATFFKRGSLYVCSVEAAGKELFFEHFDGHWVHIDADTFQDRYGKIFISGKLSDKSSVIKVDASAPQDGSFNNVVYNDYGVETRLVSPFAGFKISALYYGNSLVWEGAKDQYCTIATFFKKYDMHICSIIINGQREEFFENIGGMWVDVDEKVFSDAYLKILSGKEAEERKEIDIYTLDIASLPEETEIVKPRENSPYTFSIVAHGTPITKVVDGDSTIWTGSDEEFCISSSFLSDGRKNLLAQIAVEGHNEETELLYFQKRTFGWYQITEELYDFLIKRLNVVNEDGFLTTSYVVPLLFAVISGITML